MMWTSEIKSRPLPMRLSFFFSLLIACSVVEPAHGAPKEPTSASESAQAVYFGTDVVPMLTKLGCNSGGCHGKATGQNGFKLSLFGFEPELDYEAIVKESRGRRLSFAAPENSLLLTKATASAPHGGGRRLETDSDDYRILRNWISQGAIAPRDDDPRLLRIELSPPQQTLQTGSVQQLQVTGHFTDGSSRDVTRQAVYQANEPGIATVDEHQGQRTLSSFDTKDLHQEVIIPAADSTLHREAILAGMLFQQGQSEASEPCQIFGDRPLASSQSVFSVSDIQTPVTCRFDSPMVANSFGKLLDAEWQAADEIANVYLLFALHNALIDDHTDRLQTLPARRRGESIRHFKLKIRA